MYVRSKGCQIFNSNVNFAYARTVKCLAALGAAAEANLLTNQQPILNFSPASQFPDLFLSSQYSVDVTILRF